MCPLWPLHIVLLYLLAFIPLWYVAAQVVSQTKKFGVTFSPNELENLFMEHKQQVNVSTAELTDQDFQNSVIRAIVENSMVASVENKEIIFTKSKNNVTDVWSSAFNISGDYLGYTSVKLCLTDKNETGSNETTCKKESAENLKVAVLRKPRIVDHLFTGSVIILVCIIFINFGCALDANSLKQAVIRPIGPAIGLISHFLFLPLISYGLGLLLFPNNPTMRLGFFFTGISPAGGASNIWTYALGGNIHLSITMTAVSTLASFGLIPLWVFTLGPVIFKDGKIGVPYNRIITSAVGLLVPLAIGYLLQIYCKRVSTFMVKILKPFSALLIIFIVVFATVTNIYLFKLFNLEIFLAGIGLPFIGYLAGLILAMLLRQPPRDVLAISIETGVQNTGIAIFLLKFCLPQPSADMTTVAPVAVALMTPIPLLILLVVKKLFFKSTYEEKSLSTDDGAPCLNKSSPSIASESDKY